MPHFIVEQNLLGLLVQDTIGGQANPFKAALEFLDKTEGQWDRDNTRAAIGTASRPGAMALIAGALGTAPPAGVRWYMSKFFEESFLTPMEIAGAFGLFAATGMYGELVGYESYLQPTDYSAPVPDYLPGATVAIDDGEPQPVPWSQWRNTPPTLTHQQRNEAYYVPLQWNGHQLAGSIVARLIGDGHTVVRYNEIPEQVEPEPEPEE